jgi:hypothetical protein
MYSSFRRHKQSLGWARTCRCIWSSNGTYGVLRQGLPSLCAPSNRTRKTMIGNVVKYGQRMYKALNRDDERVIQSIREAAVAATGCMYLNSLTVNTRACARSAPPQVRHEKQGLSAPTMCCHRLSASLWLGSHDLADDMHR